MFGLGGGIAKIKGDDAILSDVNHIFTDLKEEIQLVLSTFILLKAEDTAVVKALEKQRELYMKAVHAAVYMLDRNMTGAYSLGKRLTVPTWSLQPYQTTWGLIKATF